MRSGIRFFLLYAFGGCLLGFGQQQEVTVGAQVWAYDRVYPLLDGLLQDAASTQLQQLILDPNKTNGTQLDALIQSFQMQAGFNQTAGMQNSVASQMALANLGYQASLAQQQQSVTQQSIAAQQALTKANQDLAAATQSQNQAQISVANLEVQNAQALVSGLAAQAAIVKGSGTPFSPAPATGSLAATPGNFASGVPSGVLGSGSATGGPSFPATKQLDNQMDMLWSRLARVVGAMARPDSIESNARMFMIEFDTATFPGRSRKGKLLETRYRLSCGQVVDLFPRVAAVNVANTKYRDNADIFGVALSWFTFGINAAYNREHLKMSQTLGQSSYITGYGIDQAVFGWKFGIPLGDNFVSADTKRTFALISAPTDCAQPHLSLEQAIWEKPDGRKPATEGVTTDFGLVNQTMTKAQALPGGGGADAPVAASAVRREVVESISFNRASYDPAKYGPTSPVLVAVSVVLNEPIDQEATLYANGILLKRARDTFGRAIPGGTGSGGLLEQSVSIAQANSWIPVSPHHLLITLDAGQFGVVFPTIQIINPGQGGAVEIPSVLTNQVEATVSGQPFACLTVPSGCRLPSLGYQVPVGTRVNAILWQTYCDRDFQKGCIDKLVLEAPPTTGVAAGSGKTPAGFSGVQAVAGSNAISWGPSPEVYLQIPKLNSRDKGARTFNQTQYRLNCDREDSASDAVGGGNLVCEFWDEYLSKDFDNYSADEDLQLQVIDQGYAGGALVAGTVLSGSVWGKNARPSPAFWSVSSPQWYDDSKGGHWEFQARFANTDKGSLLRISPGVTAGEKAIGPTTCDEKRLCTWKFAIAPEDLPKWFDRMDLSFSGSEDSVWHLLNIKGQISPVVAVMSADFSSWSGNNFTFVFDSGHDKTAKTGLRIGSTLIPVDCPVLNYCVVNDASKLPKTGGLMYLEALNHKFPLVQINADGTTQPISFQPAKPSGGSNGGGPGATSPGGALKPGKGTVVTGGPSK